MKKTKHFIQSTLIQYLLFVLLGVLFSCSNKIEDIGEFVEEKEMPTQIGKGVEVMYSTKGNVVFQLKTPLLHQYMTDKEYNEMPEGVEVKIFDSLMNVTTKLTANYAIDSTYANKMEAMNDVVVINEKGEKLNTEHLVWDKATEKITSDVFVKITTADQVLIGEGLISNQDFSEYRILKPRGVINIDND